MYGFNLEVQDGYNQFMIGLMEDRSMDSGGQEVGNSEWFLHHFKYSCSIIESFRLTFTVSGDVINYHVMPACELCLI